MLEPGDADYWTHLGLYKQWGADDSGNHRAIYYLQRATRTNPRSAELWADLAGADQASGNTAGALEAYREAQRNYPISSKVAWEYGSFLVYNRNFSQGYAEIKRALLVNPGLAPSAVSECWRVNPDITSILDRVLPAQANYYRAAMDFFLSRHLLEPAVAVWNRQLTLGRPTEMAQAVLLVNALIDHNLMPGAERTWQQALKATHWPQDRTNRDSLIFNGGFEHEITNGGFGWRENLTSDVRFGVDRYVVHSGSAALRIDFEGKTNVNFQNLFQLVPAEPRKRYRFSAYVRTQKLSTDQGVRFKLFDPRHPSDVHILTPNLTGTNSWTLVRSDVETGSNTNLLEIELTRSPSWKFDNKIHGTVWVDDISLAPIQTQGKSKSIWK